MNKIALVFLILNSVFFPTLPSFSGEEEQKNAAIMILLACTYSQMGQIPRSKIVETAKMGYEASHGNPKKVNWNKAITLSKKLDKESKEYDKFGCYK